MWLFDTQCIEIKDWNPYYRLIDSNESNVCKSEVFFLKHSFLIRIIIIYFIADSNKRTRDVVEEFENDARLSNYNTDGVRKVLIICFSNLMT